MTNKAELIQKIENSGYRKDFIAEKCGITSKSFRNKLNGTSYFTSREIEAMIPLLKLTSDDVMRIFFAC